MSGPTLLVMAAGIGSRYGGLKQIDPVGPEGEIILDYSVYDALQAGFARIVFLIRSDFEDEFRDRVGRTLERRVDTAYVFQELGHLPEGFWVPAERQKPWGTGHAVLSCRHAIRTPFAVINADDYYGPSAFRSMARFLSAARTSAEDAGGPRNYSMVGFLLENTLSQHGTVARGVCRTTADGYLTDIRERSKIRRFPDGVKYSENEVDWIDLPGDSIVSMNLWGFTVSIFEELEVRFSVFLRENLPNLDSAEYYLPEVVGDLLRERKARVRVLPSRERWFGVTYPEDRPKVQAAIRDLVVRGTYPARLWQ